MGVIRQSFSRVTRSRVKIIGESPHRTSFLTWFAGTQTQINRWNIPSTDRRSLAVVVCRQANTYCDAILTNNQENVSKWVTCVFPPSSSWLSLNIENYSQRYHWLACKKEWYIGTNGYSIEVTTVTMRNKETDVHQVVFWMFTVQYKPSIPIS